MHVSYTARQRLASDSRRWADRHTDKLSHCLRRWILDQSAYKWSLHQPPHFVLVRGWTNSYAIRTLVHCMCIQWSWSMTYIFVAALKSMPSLCRNAPPHQGGVAQG
jgi:hypothetical protein